jgi:hypothetical protein
VPPSRLVPRIARDLETICLKCLRKEPQKRYESAEALADDLDRYRHGDTIKARRTPAWERGYKWSKRHPIAAMFWGLFLVSVLGGTLGSIAWLRHDQRAREQRFNWALTQQTRGVKLSDLADEAERSRDTDKVRRAQESLTEFLLRTKDELERIRDEAIESQLRPTLARVQARRHSLDEWLRDFDRERPLRNAIARRSISIRGSWGCATRPRCTPRASAA